LINNILVAVLILGIDILQNVATGYSNHYGRTGLCRAAKTHGKGPNTLGKAFAERACTAKNARQ
jgi:hypothetical protein